MTTSIQRYATPLAMPFSKAVREGDFLFLSGVLPMDGEGRIVTGDIALQTRVVLERIAATLAEASASMGALVRMTVWLADLGDFAAFNDEYRRHFGGCFPAPRRSKRCSTAAPASRSRRRRSRRQPNNEHRSVTDTTGMIDGSRGRRACLEELGDLRAVFAQQ